LFFDLKEYQKKNRYDHEDILVKVENVELLSSGAFGVLCITNAGLVFRGEKTHLRIFHGMVAKADTKRKKRTGGSSINQEVLQIDCKVLMEENVEKFESSVAKRILNRFRLCCQSKRRRTCWRRC
jgi:hypothetical protein